MRQLVAADLLLTFDFTVRVTLFVVGLNRHQKYLVGFGEHSSG